MPRTLHIQNEPENEMKNEISGLFFKKMMSSSAEID